MISLYNITEEQRNIYLQLEYNEGELTPELEAALEINEKNFKHKVENYVIFLDSLNATQRMIDEEITRLTEKKKALAAKVERLENNLAVAIDTFGTEEKERKSVLKYYDVLKTRKIDLKLSKSIKVLNPIAVPLKYKTFGFGFKTDNAQIKKDIESGDLTATEDYYIEEKKVVKIK